MTTTALVKDFNISGFEKNIFWVLATSLLVFSMAYAYLVNQTILNIVAREELENSAINLNSKVSELEFEHIALKKEINMEYAYTAGFSNVKNMKFASRSLSNGGLSINLGVNNPN